MSSPAKFPKRAPVDAPDVVVAELTADAESALAARVRAGDLAAFETMYRAYHVSLVMFVSGYVHAPDVAEELVHDVFYRVWERRSDWRPAGSIGSYLYAAARNHALNHLRHRKVVEQWEAAAVAEADVLRTMGRVASTEERAQAADIAGAVARALKGLPARARQAFVLRWQQGLPVARVASSMGISEKAVERHLTQALKIVRKRLRKLL